MRTKTLLIIFALSSVFLLGILIGLTVGTKVCVGAISQFFSASQVTIDFNETRMVEAMNQTLIPELKKEYNLTRGIE